jgi:hypothetical protein
MEGEGRKRNRDAHFGRRVSPSTGFDVGESARGSFPAQGIRFILRRLFIWVRAEEWSIRSSAPPLSKGGRAPAGLRSRPKYDTIVPASGFTWRYVLLQLEE